MGQPTSSTKLNLGSFHFIKGIAISVIVFGHIATTFDLTRLTWFYPLFLLLDLFKTPFVPLFFMISGYGIRSIPLKQQFRKTAGSLLIPYLLVMVFFTILIPFVQFLLRPNLSRSISIFFSVLFAFLLGIPIPGKVIFGFPLSHCAIVWFLLAAFWGTNLVTLILKQKKIHIQVLLVLLCAVIGYTLFQLDFTYYCLPHGLIATGYFYLGYLIRHYHLLQRKFTHKWIYLIWVAAALVYAYNGNFDLCYGLFFCFPVDYFGAAILAALLLKLGTLASRLDGIFTNICSSIGIHSYWILCIHSIEQKCLPWVQYVKATEFWPNLGFALALVAKIIIITVSCKLIKHIKKRNYRRRIHSHVRT